MAAIDLTRLNKQVEELKQAFSEPTEFRKRLHERRSSITAMPTRQNKDVAPVSFMRVLRHPESGFASNRQWAQLESQRGRQRNPVSWMNSGR